MSEATEEKQADAPSEAPAESSGSAEQLDGKTAQIVEYIEGMSVNFSFEQFGEMYLYRSQTSFTAHSLIIETDGRVYTS